MPSRLLLLAAAGWALCYSALPAAVAGAEQAPPAVSAQSAIGCCVCRSSASQQYRVKSCADSYGPAACVAKCQSEGATSVAYGYLQTCQQGCAGFPTSDQ